MGEVVEGDGTGPEEVVEAHVQANKVCHIKQKGWDLVVEQVAMNVEIKKVDAGGQIWRRELDWHRTQSDIGEVKLDDMVRLRNKRVTTTTTNDVDACVYVFSD